MQLLLTSHLVHGHVRLRLLHLLLRLVEVVVARGGRRGAGRWWGGVGSELVLLAHHILLADLLDVLGQSEEFVQLVDVLCMFKMWNRGMGSGRKREEEGGIRGVRVMGG